VLTDTVSYFHDSVNTGDGVTTQYGYDAAGQPRTQTYQNGAATATMALDAEGRLTALGDGAGHTDSFAYNADDQTTAITLPNGVSEQASYDANGRLTAWHDPGPGQNVTYAYGHDAASRVTSFTAVSGTDTLTYNPQNRLTSDCGSQMVARSPDGCYHWTYDGAGNISTTTTDAGTSITYTYNPQNNELMTLYAPAYANTMTYYAYDGSGHTTAITSPVGGSLTAPGAINTHLGYDTAGRVNEGEDPLQRPVQLSRWVTGASQRGRRDGGRLPQLHRQLSRRRGRAAHHLRVLAQHLVADRLPLHPGIGKIQRGDAGAPPLVFMQIKNPRFERHDTKASYRVTYHRGSAQSDAP
jgi:YD repeat-containing protein